MLKALLSILLFFVIVSLWGFYWGIRPIRIISSVTPKTFNIPYENISFRTQDNVVIKGWFIPSKKPNAKTIILLHGYPADKGDILASRLFLHSSYNLLFIDFRYFGESGGKYTTVGKQEVLDLLGAIQYLHTRNMNDVGVWGLSLGGAVALITATQTPAIKAIVTESSYARLDWMIYDYYTLPLLRYPLGVFTRAWAWLFLHYDITDVSPARAAESLRIPILLLHSKQDKVVSFEHALLLQTALTNNPHTTFIFPDNDFHGSTADTYEQTIKDFFDRNLAGAPTHP